MWTGSYMALDRATDKERAANVISVPTWVVAPALAGIIGLLGWGASMMWDSRELVREMAVSTRYELAQLRTDVMRAGEDRFTGSQARDALALRDQRIEANAQRIDAIEREAERERRAERTRGR